MSKKISYIDEMQAIYLLSNPKGSMKLYEFVIIFGCFMLILAQIPSFHSLRHINLLSLILCLAYSAAATAASIYIGIFSNHFSSFRNLAISTLCFINWIEPFWFPIYDIVSGESSKGPEKDYSIKGDTENRLFGVFNAIAIIATTYGNGIIPEIQVHRDN